MNVGGNFLQRLNSWHASRQYPESLISLDGTDIETTEYQANLEANSVSVLRQKSVKGPRIKPKPPNTESFVLDLNKRASDTQASDHSQKLDLKPTEKPKSHPILDGIFGLLGATLGAIPLIGAFAQLGPHENKDLKGVANTGRCANMCGTTALLGAAITSDPIFMVLGCIGLGISAVCHAASYSSKDGD